MPRARLLLTPLQQSHFQFKLHYIAILRRGVQDLACHRQSRFKIYISIQASTSQDAYNMFPSSIYQSNNEYNQENSVSTKPYTPKMI